MMSLHNAFAITRGPCSYSLITMARRQAHRVARERKRQRATEERWADFADHVLEIAREIQFRGYASAEAVSLTPSEGTVMRSLFAHPGALPSEVAFATGLQRSNLSAVLRGLEEKGLIERVADPEDGRWVRIHATRRAIRNYELVRREWGSAVAAAAEGDPPVETALPLLAKVRAGLVRQRQSEGRR
jgi:DNA-binding MarR family transcriptional regulator